MPAGRELDALIAKIIYPEAIEFYAFPNYSTDISAAWEVIEKLHGVSLNRHHKYWLCYFDQDFDMGVAQGETAPLAVCRAALLAVTE